MFDELIVGFFFLGVHTLVEHTSERKGETLGVLLVGVLENVLLLLPL